MLAFGLVATFLAIVLLVFFAYDYQQERSGLKRTLRGVGKGGVADDRVDVRKQQLAAPVVSRAFIPALKAAGRGARRFTPMDVFKRLEEELTYAGNPPGWDAERILAFKLLLPPGLAILGFLLARFAELDTLLTIATIGLFAVVGYYLPEWLVRSAAEKRQSQIRRTLPDALDLLSITVEAGLSFDAALVRVARNMRGALGEELYRVVQEIQLGKSRSEALRDLGERTNVDDLRSFVLAMVQAEVFGIPIANVLKIQAGEIRLRKRQRAEEQAQKLPVKIVFPLILGIFPAIFVVLLGPAAIQIFEALGST